MQSTKIRTASFFTACSLALLTACGGGSSGTTTGTGGAPSLSNKCQISGVQVSSGDTATLSKASSALNVTLNLNLSQALTVRFTSNFESAGADDWIEAVPLNRSYTAGDNSVTINYDLNSPSKSIADRYTKLNVTALLPDNEACVANKAVNITLNP
jgi:hypothetical protein